MKKIRKSFTFDDVLLVPQRSDVLPSGVDLSTRITPNIQLRIPILSAAMDTVTEHALAIAMAREGGIGIIHKNLSIADQANEVHMVKRAESGVISNPYTLAPEDTLAKVFELKKSHKIGGFPVLKNERLVGILTNRDIRFETDPRRKVKELMTPRERLVTAPADITLEEAKTLLQKNRIEKLLLVEADDRLAGMLTVRDIMKRIDYPNAAQDSKNRLLTGAAIGVTGDFLERAQELVRMGADLLVIDTAHGHQVNIAKALKKVKNSVAVDVIAGNVATLHGHPISHRCRRGCCESGHRPRLDLHHKGDRRDRRSPAHGRDGLRGSGCPAQGPHHCRRRHQVFRRYRQSPGRRRGGCDDRVAVCRHR